MPRNRIPQRKRLKLPFSNKIDSNVQNAANARELERGINELPYLQKGRYTLANDDPTSAATFEVWDVENTLDILDHTSGKLNIEAVVYGWVGNDSATARQLRLRVDISIDGGTTYDNGRVKRFGIGGLSEVGFSHAHEIEGIPTGDIMVRVMLYQEVGANTNWEDGFVHWEILPID